MQVFINGSLNAINAVVTNFKYFIRAPTNHRYSLSELRQLIIESAELINKRMHLTDTTYMSGRAQSVSWHFINEFLEYDLDTDLAAAFNKLLLEMNIAFDTCGELAAKGADIKHFDIARDLNETMKLLNIPITFHPAIYGTTVDNETVRSRVGRSSIRRPIAKAELALAWLAYLLRLTRTPQRFTPMELTFINTIGLMLDVFIKRYDLIVNVKYQQPCLDHLAFIRLMEIAYITTIHSVDTENVNVYGSWLDQPGQFDYIPDFGDIRLSLDGPRSHLSRLPRMPCSYSWKRNIFYNPVKCMPSSPIYALTENWIKSIEGMRNDDSFENIVKRTAITSFSYEKGFISNGTPSRDAEWYKDVEVFTLTDTDDEKLYDEQTKLIEEKLVPIKELYKDMSDIEFSGMAHNDERVNVIFSVMIRSSESDKPELSYVQI